MCHDKELSTLTAEPQLQGAGATDAHLPILSYRSFEDFVRTPLSFGVTCGGTCVLACLMRHSEVMLERKHNT